MRVVGVEEATAHTGPGVLWMWGALGSCPGMGSGVALGVKVSV